MIHKALYKIDICNNLIKIIIKYIILIKMNKSINNLKNIKCRINSIIIRNLNFKNNKV